MAIYGAAAAAGLFLVLPLLLVGVLRLTHGGVLPGVSVAGTDLGGRSETQARDAIATLAAQRRDREVTLFARGRPFALAAQDAGYELDVEATLAAVLEPGRAGGVLSSNWAHVAALWRDIDVQPVQRVDEAALDAWVARVATDVDDPPSPGSLQVDPVSLRVATTPPEAGEVLDRDATADLLRELLTTTADGPVTAPTITAPSRVEPSAVDALAGDARRAVEAPLVLRVATATVTLQPPDLARILRVEAVDAPGGGVQVRLGADPGAVEAVVGAQAARLAVAPVDAALDLPREPPATLDDQRDTEWTPVPIAAAVTPSRTGRAFDPGLAARQIGDLLATGTRTGDLRLRPVEPEFTTDDARALGITSLIGTFTTYHACCQSRVTNIQLLADLVDGTRVAPGEQFSVNQISGERTCDKGFRPAGMIANGRLIDVCGGGVSQFGTTIFNAAFFAGLPIDQYKAHSWYISRYPMGREATLNFPSPDLDVRWTNTTDDWILVRTSYTGTSITVSLYGDNGSTQVAAVHGEPFDFHGFTTRFQEDPSLPPGGERTIQRGARGFSVNVERVIRRPGRDEVREEYFTRYVPITRIVARNSG